MKTLIAPSILSADFSRMETEVKRIEQAGADWVHCDVMDGVFVPNITFGPKFIEDIAKTTALPLDVHLMITKPERYIDRFIKAGADLLTVHFEAADHPCDVLQKIKSCGVKPGIAISPDTPVAVLKGLLKFCDAVLLMSVYPGFGGQSFIKKSLDRLEELAALAKNENPEIIIEIDGGVTFENASKIKAAGAQVLVAGSAVFSAGDPAAAIKSLRG